MKYMLYILIGLVTCTGCKKNEPELSDPQQVATAFCNAMAVGELDVAMSYVLPADRDEYREATVEVLKSLPDFPKHPQILVEAKDNRGLLTIQHWADGTLGGEMRCVSNRWWMCN
jgi:hypothetical protein